MKNQLPLPQARGHLTRRTVLGASAAAPVALVLAACSDSATTKSTATAASASTDLGTITVGTDGGQYQQIQQQYAVAVLNKLPHPPKVNYLAADDATRDTMMQTQRNSASGTLDVYTGDITLPKIAQEGLLQRLDTTLIPNLAHVPQSLRNPYWIPQMQSVSGIVYDTSKFDTPPDSYNDLFGSQYADKVGIFSIQWHDWFHAASTVAQGEDARTGWDKGIALLEKLGKTVQVVSDQTALGAALQSGQVWLGLDWAAKPFGWNQQDGNDDIGFAVPKEGTFAIVFGMGIPKNAPNKRAAYAYLNAMLEPSVQRQYAEQMGYSPTVTNADVPSSVKIPRLTVAQQKLVKPLDLTYVADNYARWGQIWQQQIITH
jgi:putative spermidine/putrescine transport system substrate-binding protein